MTDRFDGSVGYALARAAMAHRSAAFALLADIGLHPGQEFLLHQLWVQDGRSQTDLATALGVEPPTVTKMVTRMEAGGLVERRPDADDRRLSRVWLTAAGRDLEPEVREAWEELERRTTAGISDRQATQLRRLLEQVREDLGGPGRPGPG